MHLSVLQFFSKPHLNSDVWIKDRRCTESLTLHKYSCDQFLYLFLLMHAVCDEIPPPDRVRIRLCLPSPFYLLRILCLCFLSLIRKFAELRERAHYASKWTIEGICLPVSIFGDSLSLSFLPWDMWVRKRKKVFSFIRRKKKSPRLSPPLLSLCVLALTFGG